MNAKQKLTNSIISKIQNLSEKRLRQMYKLLTLSNKIQTKKKQLQFAGSWEELDNTLLNDLTYKLHLKRQKDSKMRET